MFARPLRLLASLLFTAAFAAAMFGIVLGFEIYREYSIAGGLIGTLIPAIVVTAIVPAAFVPIARWIWQLKSPREDSLRSSGSQLLSHTQDMISETTRSRQHLSKASSHRFITFLRNGAAVYFFLAAFSAVLLGIDIVVRINSIVSLAGSIYLVILTCLVAIYAKSGVDLIKTASSSRHS